SEVLTPADEEHHIDKWPFKAPFVCGARNLGEALRRVGEGAAMIRTKGEAGSGNIVEAVRHLRAITGEIRQLTALREEELMAKAIVRATTHYNEPQVVAECSGELGEAMRGIDVSKLDQKELLQTRGW